MKDIKNALEAIFTLHRVLFLPTVPLPVPGQRGPPVRKPSLHHWIMLGASKNTQQLSLDRLPSHEARLQAQLRQTTAAAAAQHPSAEWTVESLSLQDLGNHLNRTHRPLDWAYDRLPTNGSDHTTADTYIFANELFRSSPSHPACKLATVFAAFLTKLRPSVHFPSESDPARVPLPAGASVTVEFLRMQPWVAKPLKGLTDTPLYFTTVSLGLVGWLHKDSPLRLALASGGGIGKYNSKHCMSISPSYVFRIAHSLPLSPPAPKGLSVHNLLRLGIAKHTSARVLNASPSYPRDYSILDSGQLEKWSTELTSLLQQPYGAFRLALKVFGHQAVSDLLQRGVLQRDLTIPFMVPPPAPQPPEEDDQPPRRRRRLN